MERLAGIARDDGMLRPDRLDDLLHLLQRHLGDDREHVGGAELHVDATTAEIDHGVEVEIGHRVFGMRDQHPLELARQRVVGDREDLFLGKVPGRQDGVIGVDDVDHFLGLGRQLAALVEHAVGLVEGARPLEVERHRLEAVGAGAAECARVLVASSVGSQTSLAPVSIASSTAAGLTPPTPRLSAIAA